MQLLKRLTERCAFSLKANSAELVLTLIERGDDYVEATVT
jgi:hypothetical protein